MYNQYNSYGYCAPQTFGSRHGSHHGSSFQENIQQRRLMRQQEDLLRAQQQYYQAATQQMMMPPQMPYGYGYPTPYDYQQALLAQLAMMQY